MIQLLATRYNKHIALALTLVFYMSIVVPAYGMIRQSVAFSESHNSLRHYGNLSSFTRYANAHKKSASSPTRSFLQDMEASKKSSARTPDSVNIDGPGQPEMSSFKPAGTNDMVNLFTGDFSYNIPLLDVGGYPVNIFYSGGITMEQEASWVGLGWNINPGNINRNVRGIPDDFNGEEKLVQEQNMKKNITWGVSMGADLELIGIKQWNQFFSGTIGASLGYSLNNYLGPAIELGLKGTTSFRVGAKGISEKGPIGVSAGLDANLNSRSGMTLTPNISLSANLFNKANWISTGIGASTSYNSRNGIKTLQLSEQMSMNYSQIEKEVEGDYNRNSVSASKFSSSISFTKPSYIPFLRSSITNSSGAGRFQLGGAMFGVYPSFEVEGYGQVSTIEPADRKLEKPMVGYLYAEKAKGNASAVMDFTRFNDQEVTPTTSIVSVPQYSYDVFSVQGEGTGGTIRAYRNDNGYVRDNFTNSKDKSWSAGVDVGIPGHVGTNFNTVKTPSTIGEWNNGNTLRNTIGFTTADQDHENVYFRNPGENAVLEPNQFDNIGGTDLVRYKLGGSLFAPAIESKLQKMTPSGVLIGEVQVSNLIGNRKKRTQVVSFLTAEEAGNVGLDKKINVYNSDPQNFLDANNKLSIVQQIDRWSVGGDRKKHHISQVNVTEADGKRYVYGVPVYNLEQKDFSFTVADNCSDCDLVSFAQSETDPSGSAHMNTSVGGKDGYVQNTTTPAYAHSFLLTGLLSPDYVDVNDDGITEDDLGTAVKFNYTKVNDHYWRTPMMNGKANSNPGNLSEGKDDKGLISYGKRESWFLQSVESKTMIAFFTLQDRTDGKGIENNSPFAPINYSDNSLKALKQIDLYNKADLKKNGLAGAKPIKTVHFDYDYSLCPNTPDNQSGGKLTLTKIWFTYNGQNRSNKNQYVFSYTKGSTAAPGENPSYLLNESDRWGNYKPATENPSSIKNRDYPYSIQQKTDADKYAGAWNLKKILLPSGGQLEIEYESDDYAFVQNKRAAVMSGIIGFSNSSSNPCSNLYLINGSSIIENNYIFIKVSEACSSKIEVYQKYLEGLGQLSVKLLVNMPKGPEYLTSYAIIDDYGAFTGAGEPAIWIKMKPVMDKGIAYSPLSVTAMEFLRERLPGQAFKAYDVSEGTSLDQLENMFKGLMEGIKTTFSRIPQYLREKGKAQSVQVNKSFARLNDPDGYKYGGGYRVKTVKLKDNWDRMTNQYGSTYGQQYEYTTKETYNGVERTISSGVASYEPSIGGEENPFQSIIQISNDVPLGPTSYGAIEMPVMDAFFPAPLVGYSKVTVTSLGKQQNPDPANKKTRSAVGRQVTEFYTAKDFPVYYTYTPLDGGGDMQKHVNPTLSFFYKYAFDSRAISQGFLVAINDMHGKMKSQSSYAENDPSTRINYTENFYRNTGSKGLDEKFNFVYNSLGGQLQEGNMGIDIELMTDTREFSLKSKSFEIQAQVDWMLPPPFPLWLPFIWPVVSESENVYRAVTTTKIINYHAVLDSVLVIDKGSQVSTKNLVYDAETGQVVVNRTNNEFDKPVYSVNYPAYWAYSGMEPAYKNIDAVFSAVDFLDGKIANGISPADQKRIFESGDELYIIDAGSPSGCSPVMSPVGLKDLIWVLNRNKDISSLTDVNPDFVFIDKSGKLFSRSDVKFRIVRSGKRNMLNAPVAGISSMTDPIFMVGGGRRLVIDNAIVANSANKIINASAVEYREKWQTDNDIIRKYNLVYNASTCAFDEVEDCNGYLEKNINPYRKGLLGNFHGYRNMVFYGSRAETNPTVATNLLQNGFLSSFQPYWNFNSYNNLVPDASNTKWVWNTQTTRFNAKGMELETKDALNIYTAAQYGYSQTLPISIVSNSRFDEMMHEGFEDNSYAATLNTTSNNPCARKHVDLSDMANSQIINTDLIGLNAHTGKYVLAINGNSTASKLIGLNPQAGFPNYDFSLPMSTLTTGSLYDQGVFNENVPYYSNGSSNQLPLNYICSAMSGGGGFLCRSYPGWYVSYNPPYYSANLYYNLEASQYYEIKEDANYNITLSKSASFRLDACRIDVKIYDASNNFVTRINQPASSQSSGVFAYSQNICLPKGIYRMDFVISVVMYQNCTGGEGCFTVPYSQDVQIGEEDFEFSIAKSGSPALIGYKTLNNIPECSFTKPIAASDSMLNPIFGISANKKMLFSAWVRESNTQQATYTNNEVQIDFGSGNASNVTLKPAGPIIEGWQRYEGYFTAPSDVSQTQLKFVNNSSQSIYFDDIRIHPFNANMKCYVYDPVNLRLKSELDANNYATYYEYDEEGTLIRTKAETREGIKTVAESRSAKQKTITDFYQ